VWEYRCHKDRWNESTKSPWESNKVDNKPREINKTAGSTGVPEPLHRNKPKKQQESVVVASSNRDHVNKAAVW
jgi:hypothetical protein